MKYRRAQIFLVRQVHFRNDPPRLSSIRSDVAQKILVSPDTLLAIGSAHFIVEPDYHRELESGFLRPVEKHPVSVDQLKHPAYSRKRDRRSFYEAHDNAIRKSARK